MEQLKFNTFTLEVEFEEDPRLRQISQQKERNDLIVQKKYRANERRKEIYKKINEYNFKTIKKLGIKELFLKVNKYLTEYENSLKRQLMRKGMKALIDAGMGFGKSVVSVNIAKSIITQNNYNNNFIVVITTHTTALGQQLYNKNNLKTFKGAIYFDDNKKLKEDSKLIVCVYDKLDQLQEFYPNKDFITIVDECHEMIEGSSELFRSEAMDKLEKFIDESYSAMFLSGTPEVFELAKEYLNPNLFNRVLRFNKYNKEIKINNLNILFSENKEEDLYKVIDHLFNKNKKVFLTINSRKQIKIIKKTLEELYPNKKIIDIDSTQKHTEKFKKLIANGKLDFDILISTKLLETGISLEYENMSTIRYITNINQTTINSICQNFVRVRTDQEDCFLILNKNEEIKNIRSFEDIFEETKQDAEMHRSYFENCIKKATPYRLDNLRNTILTFNYLKFDYENKIVIINDKAVLNEAYREYQTQYLYYSNSNLLCKKLNMQLEADNIKLISVDELGKREDFDETVKQIKEQIKEIEVLNLEEYKLKLYNVFHKEEECYKLVDQLQELNLIETKNIAEKQKLDQSKQTVKKYIAEYEQNILDREKRIESFKLYLKNGKCKDLHSFNDYDKMIILSLKNHEVIDKKIKHLVNTFEKYNHVEKYIESKFDDAFIKQQIIIGYNNDYKVDEIKEMLQKRKSTSGEFFEYLIIRSLFDDKVKGQQRITKKLLITLNQRLIYYSIKKPPKKTQSGTIDSRTEKSLIKKIGLIYNLVSDNKGYKLSRLKQ